ncbi:hypothetical protein T12_14008 [Trichinella patagoniensis]|uniref:Uncharacterized protein n=1 Tax=Trichinella patagoniensis TaxID=990121 RepID=A0A0V0Z0V0_9BILA|nr:hypothetical protein T12_14134 [Trichinella patagoniensis]KRY06502.1 hypothetical protein T12_14008 [Trichinella patagoniensis]
MRKISCGLCRLMKLVLMPTSVHLAFNGSQPMALSNCVSYGSVLPCHKNNQSGKNHGMFISM